jgi:hypothetical protein
LIVIVGATGTGYTVNVIVGELTVAGLAHVAFEVRSTLITSLFANVHVVKVGLFCPAGVLFIVHAKFGLLPPVLIWAVNVTQVPGHIGLCGWLLIVTEGVTVGFAVTNTAADVAEQLNWFVTVTV